MNVVICDDVPEVLETLETSIHNCPYFKNHDVNIIQFGGEPEFIAALKNDISVDFIS
jgi:hypothetical protein